MMKKREIGIVAAAGVALVYFGSGLFAPKVQSKTVDCEKVQQCEAFVEQSRRILAGMKYSPVVEHHLELLASEDWNNRFIRSGLLTLNGAKSAIVRKDPVHLISYVGYVAAGEQCWALINNQEYMVNDLIEHMNLKVVEISKEYVVLSPQDSESAFGEEGELITVIKKVENELF